MCWKVSTLRLCFVINPVRVREWMLVKLYHAPNLCMRVCSVSACANQSAVRELAHALTCPDWAKSDQEWCPSLRYCWFHRLRQHQAVSLSLPKMSCPLFWLGFSWKTQAVWSPNMAVVGWVCCYPPLAFSDRQLSILCPFSHAWWKGITVGDWKWFSQDFKQAQLCLRSAWGVCSYMSSNSARTHLFSHLAHLFKTVVFWCA